MQNRFGKEKGNISVLRDILLPAVLTVTVLVMVGTGVSNVQSAAREQQLASVEEAVRRAAVHCYAVEGFYPPDLNYLLEHYGLSVDAQEYVVHYSAAAANLMPDIRVLRIC